MKCVEVKCPILPDVVADWSEVGTILVFSCPMGFELKQKSVKVICHDSGTWIDMSTRGFEFLGLHHVQSF